MTQLVLCVNNYAGVNQIGVQLTFDKVVLKPGLRAI